MGFDKVQASQSDIPLSTDWWVWSSQSDIPLSTDWCLWSLDGKIFKIRGQGATSQGAHLVRLLDEPVVVDCPNWNELVLECLLEALDLLVVVLDARRDNQRVVLDLSGAVTLGAAWGAGNLRGLVSDLLSRLEDDHILFGLKRLDAILHPSRALGEHVAHGLGRVKNLESHVAANLQIRTARERRLTTPSHTPRKIS